MTYRRCTQATEGGRGYILSHYFIRFCASLYVSLWELVLVFSRRGAGDVWPEDVLNGQHDYGSMTDLRIYPSAGEDPYPLLSEACLQESLNETLRLSRVVQNRDLSVLGVVAVCHQHYDVGTHETVPPFLLMRGYQDLFSQAQVNRTVNREQLQVKER